MKKIIFLILLCFTSKEYGILPQKVIVCGVCKNVEKQLPFSIKIMENIGALFSGYRIIVYENNSSDQTPQILKKWANNNENVLAISENILQSELEMLLINRLKNNDFYVPEAIARARNIVLDKAMSEAYQDFDYLIWMDMDFIREPSYEGIIEVFTTIKEWDAVFAYGIDPLNKHWDWYALRDQVCPLGPELLGNEWWYLPKHLFLTVKNDWYPVYSAFGGCGIYKKSSLLDCHYSALVTSDLAQCTYMLIQEQPTHPIIQQYLNNVKNLESNVMIEAPCPNNLNIENPNIGIITPCIPENIVWRMNSFVYKYPCVCEHVTLHASMIVRGFNKLFINPRLIFRYSSD